MKDIKNLCMGCMEELKNGDDICSKCGERRGAAQETPFLPKKTIIGSRYAVGTGLEINGEGLSYIGYDTAKEIKVYIREFFPSGICTRGEDFTSVRVSPYKSTLFDKQLSKFLKYFRAAARLRNIPALSAIYDIFNQNGTAYVIIEWIEGRKLDKFLGDKSGIIPWDEARGMFLPLASALGNMHEAGVLHLGISPSNILVEEDGSLRLSGFATKDLRKLDSPIEAQLYDGFSALEQYIEIYDTDQSTDVYGFTACLFLALTGEPPLNATKRKKDDRLFMPKDIVRVIPDNVISGIASGLRVYPNNRTLSFERLKVELSNSPIAQISLAEEESVGNITDKKDNPIENKNKNFILGVLSCVVALIVLVACFVIYWFVLKKNNFKNLQSGNNDREQAQVYNVDLDKESESNDKNKIVVPDLTGKKFEDLKKQDISQVGYEVLLLSEEFSDEIAQGRVTSQTPGAGESIDEGSSVAVNISKGSKMRQLPAITGKSISEASLALSSMGLIPEESWGYNDNVPEGQVVGYADHQEGGSVEYGSKITIVRSLGAGRKS